MMPVLPCLAETRKSPKWGTPASLVQNTLFRHQVDITLQMYYSPVRPPVPAECVVWGSQGGTPCCVGPFLGLGGDHLWAVQEY